MCAETIDNLPRMTSEEAISAHVAHTCPVCQEPLVGLRKTYTRICYGRNAVVHMHELMGGTAEDIPVFIHRSHAEGYPQVMSVLRHWCTLYGPHKCILTNVFKGDVCWGSCTTGCKCIGS